MLEILFVAKARQQGVIADLTETTAEAFRLDNREWIKHRLVLGTIQNDNFVI